MFEFIKKLFSKPVEEPKTVQETVPEDDIRIIKGVLFPKVDDPRWELDFGWASTYFITMANKGETKILLTVSKTSGYSSISVGSKSFADANNPEAKRYVDTVLCILKKKEAKRILQEQRELIESLLKTEPQ